MLTVEQYQSGSEFKMIFVTHLRQPFTYIYSKINNQLSLAKIYDTYDHVCQNLGMSLAD